MADALAASRAPKLSIILVCVDCYWNLLMKLMIVLCWELGARSARPKGQALKDSFTVLYVLAFDGAPTAGAASAA